MTSGAYTEFELVTILGGSAINVQRDSFLKHNHNLECFVGESNLNNQMHSEFLKYCQKGVPQNM